MKNKILVIVPSRGARLENYERLIKSWQETSEGYSDLMWALDDDDHMNYPTKKIDRMYYSIAPRMKMIPTLNYVAVRYCNQYEWIAFLGDDHVFRTPWESKFMETGPVSICYGNDLLQGANLPTAVCMTSNIIGALGYMIPPGLIHMFADNFWRDLGHLSGTLNYFDDVVIEHMHFSAGKSQEDAQYTEVNGYLGPDAEVYQQYAVDRLPYDAQQVRNLKANLINYANSNNRA